MAGGDLRGLPAVAMGRHNDAGFWSCVGGKGDSQLISPGGGLGDSALMS